MKKTIKNKKLKYLIIGLIVLLIIILGLLVVKNLFAGSDADRYEGIENYKVTNNEKNEIKSIFDIEGAKVDVYVKSKIIRISVVLADDVEFDKIKELANNSIYKIKEKNLSYYDVEIFVKSKNKESETYPQIGYKHKTNSEFVW